MSKKLGTKLRNSKTGLWYRKGANFTEPCMLKATTHNAPELAFLRATFDNNFVEVNIQQQGSTNCDCDNCAETTNP